MAERIPLFISSEGYAQELSPTADSITVAGLTMNGNVVMGGNLITGLGTPVSDTDAATKIYVDNVAAGLDPKESVRVATTAALPANTAAGSGVGKTLTMNAVGVLTVDGVATVLGDRILVKDEANAVNNGIYTVTTEGTASVAAILTRATDFDGSPGNEVTAGAYTFVEEGTVNANSGWVLSTNNPITVDTTALNFAQFSGTGQITAGAGLVKTGSVLDVELAVDPGLEFDVSGTAGKLRAKVDTTRGLGRDAAGLFISLATNPGLQFSGGALDWAPDTARGLSKDASGAFVNLAANSGLQFTSGALDTLLDSVGSLQKGVSGLSVKIDPTPSTLTSTASGLSVTGLPSLFTINGTPVGATVTAANLDTLTDGSNADALHTHAGANTAQHLENNLAVDSAVAVGDVVYFTSTGDRVAPADAATLGTVKPIGVARTAQSTIGSTTTVVSSGPCLGVLSAATPGTRYFLAAGGGLTPTRPTGAGNRLIQMGFAINATDLWVEIQDFGRRGV